MRAKSLVLLIMALGCGLVASVGINQYLTGKETTTEAAEGTVLVLVASQEIPKSMTVNENMVRLEQWPEGTAPSGAINDTNLAVGRVVKQTVYPGEPLLELKLAEEGAERPEATIPKHLRAFTVPVDNKSGVAGFVRPGARVDVILSLARNQENRTARSKTILTNVEVWAVDQTITEDEDDPQASPAKAVTLLVNSEDAERLTLATTQGTVFLSLRHPGDESEEVPARGTTLNDLVGKSASSGSDENPIQKTPDSFGNFLEGLAQGTPQDTAPDSQPDVAPAGPTHTMVIIHGSQVEEKTFSLK